MQQAAPFGLAMLKDHAGPRRTGLWVSLALRDRSNLTRVYPAGRSLAGET